MFCNWQGLPRFWGKVQVEAGEPIGPPQADRINRAKSPVPGAHRSAKRKDMTTIYTVAYYLLLVAGAYGFKKLLWSLTESPGVLVQFT